MPRTIFILALLTPVYLIAQTDKHLRTADHCNYMQPDEKEMIYELNRLRSNPKSYLQYVEPRLAGARETLKKFGKGERNYSLTFSTILTATGQRQTIDTVWHFRNEENVKALASLVADLKKTPPLSVLIPDSGIYNAACKHTGDQDNHKWKLIHTGSDQSQPWDRISKFSPGMTGNENIAGRFPYVKPREIILQLLDDAGIPGYGHRYNILNPDWTHVACVSGGLKEGMFRWIQNFGRRIN